MCDEKFTRAHSRVRCVCSGRDASTECRDNVRCDVLVSEYRDSVRCVCVRARVCVCVCVCTRARACVLHGE